MAEWIAEGVDTKGKPQKIRVTGVDQMEGCAMPTRDTPYATELASAVFTFPDGQEGRIERLFIKREQQEAIRFSWWKEGRMIPRPLDLDEKELISLIRAAVAQNVFTAEFISELRSALAG